MNKKKIMATSLTALTLLSTGAITTYVANNVIVEAESNTNTKVQKTIWLLDNGLVKELSGDHKAEEIDLTGKNAKLDRTEIQGSIRRHHFVTKTTTNTTNPVTPPVSLLQRLLIVQLQHQLQPQQLRNMNGLQKMVENT